MTKNNSPLNQSLWNALGTVMDPEIRRPVTELGMITKAAVSSDGVADIQLLLTITGCPAARSIETATRNAAASVVGVHEVDLEVGVMTPEQRADFVTLVRGTDAPRASQFGPDSLTRVIAVTSGKGGVGKSSITANLAVSLAERGLDVGLIDADVFGFSIPGIMGLSSEGVTASPTRIDNMIVAPEAHGVSIISIGMFLGEGDARNTAVSWRGPMLHRTMEQFLRDVWFGDLDVLLLDLPPGTGDIAISMGQLLPQAEVIVVTTPQLTAADVAVRSGIVAFQSGQSVLGVIENMSGLEQADGTVLELFGAGGGADVAHRLNEHAQRSDSSQPVELLGQIPISMALRESADSGIPLVLSEPTDPAAAVINQVAEQIISRGRNLSGKKLPLATL